MTTAQDTILTRPWRKSSHSTGGNDCIEVAQAGRSCLVRDSKNRDGARLAVVIDAFDQQLNHAGLLAGRQRLPDRVEAG